MRAHEGIKFGFKLALGKTRTGRPLWRSVVICRTRPGQQLCADSMMAHVQINLVTRRVEHRHAAPQSASTTPKDDPRCRRSGRHSIITSLRTNVCKRRLRSQSLSDLMSTVRQCVPEPVWRMRHAEHPKIKIFPFLGVPCWPGKQMGKPVSRPSSASRSQQETVRTFKVPTFFRPPRDKEDRNGVGSQA